ncbi:MAG: acyl-CoA thioesterase [Planctomycetota bacterium]|nr:acyl-CoA thioesterase [Planctomycetota bacterium]
MFVTPYSVRFADVDNAGIFYYPRFFHAFHVAMEQWWESVGRPYHVVITEDRIGFPAVHIESDFKKPVTFGDPVDIHVGIARLGTTSVTIRYKFVDRVTGTTHCQTDVVTACVNMDTFRPVEPPPHLRELLETILIK